MKAIFELEWDDKLGQDWMTEDSLDSHLKRHVKERVVVHKLYDMSNDIRGHIFRNGIRLVKTWATGE